MHQHNIRHRIVTPYWPSVNGEVERFNRTLGKTIKAAHVTKHNWKSELDQLVHASPQIQIESIYRSEKTCKTHHPCRKEIMFFKRIYL